MKGFGFLIACLLFLGALVAGTIPDELAGFMPELLHSFEQWWLGYFPYPIPTSILITFMIIWFVILPIMQRVEQKKQIGQFNVNIAALRDNNREFFPLLEQAYRKWRNGNGLNLPEKVDDFIDSIDYPCWLRKKYRSLQQIADEKVDKSNPRWAFVFDLYTEVEDVRNSRKEPNLLSTKDEYEAFHKVRLEIDKFWMDVAEKVYNQELAYKDIKDKLETQHRTLKLIPLIAVVLNKIHNQKGCGGFELYILAYRFHKKSFSQYLREKLCPKANT